MNHARRFFGEFRGRRATCFKVWDPDSGFEVAFCDLGASVVQVTVPTPSGELVDASVRCESVGELVGNLVGYVGVTVGRVANRIGGAKFELEGREYRLHANDGPNCLHGGREGFSHKWWDVAEFGPAGDGRSVRLTFEYESPDGEEGFPGTVAARVEYVVEPSALEWTFAATADRTTPVNLTNHAYWNLGDPLGVVDDHVLWLDADRYLPVDADLLATGEVVDVGGTPLDFRRPTRLGDAFERHGDVDNSFLVAGSDGFPGGDLRHVATVSSPAAGLQMRVFTTERCVQVYTGNFMGALTHRGRPCQKHGAICLETQRVPNAVNLDAFRESVLLRPGGAYHQRTRHEFAPLEP